MSSAPVEYIMIEFPGVKIGPKVVPALKQLVDSELIRIVDLVFVRKDADGSTSSYELTALDGDEITSFDEVDGEVSGMLSEDDIREAAQNLAPDSSAAFLVWENLWAARFSEAIRASGGRVVINERIPDAVVEAARQALEAEA